MKKKKIIITIILAAFIIVFAAGVFIGNYFYNLALNPQADRSDVLNASHNQIEGPEETEEGTASNREEELNAWEESITYEPVKMTSFDGLTLRAHIIYQETSTDRWVILAHGYGMSGTQMNNSAKRFYDQGYNVLMPDARGHGDSEGDYIGMGWHERLDMVDWINQIVAQQPDAEIVLYGVSMGGATVMMTAGEVLPDNVKAIVEDCGYSSVKAEFEYQLKQLYGIPSFPVINFASAVTRIRAGYTFGEASAVEQLKKTQVPILFIHGDADTFVPSLMLDEVYEAAAGEKEKYLVAGAGHGMASTIAGAEYWEKVFGFIEKY